jgi:hypothetical protein
MGLLEWSSRTSSAPLCRPCLENCGIQFQTSNVEIRSDKRSGCKIPSSHSVCSFTYKGNRNLYCFSWSDFPINFIWIRIERKWNTKKSSKSIHIKETQIFKFDSWLFYSRLRISTHIYVRWSLQANISQLMGSVTPGCIYRMLQKFTCFHSFRIIDIFRLNTGPAQREVEIFISMSRVPLSP